VIYIFIPHVPAEPIGGVQTLFDYAERLNELAQTTVAKIICPAPYIRSILPREYPLVPTTSRKPKLMPHDVLVLPETLASTLDEYPRENKKYLAVLNYGYFEVYARRMPKIANQVTGFLTNSQFTARELRKRYPHKNISYIPHVIEPRFTAMIPFNKREQYSILVMNRKNTHHIPKVLAFLESVPHKVTVVNNISSDELLKLYNKHQIFINLGYPEGFCRPAAEAMACGCVVVGFTGGGGSDFMKHRENSFIAADGNDKELIELLSYTLHTLSKKELLSISKQGRATISSTYNKSNQAKKLYQVFKKQIGQVYSTNSIERLYKALGTAVKVSKRKPIYANVSKETLELQLFNERQKYAELTSSKVFSLWQKYCAMRDTLKNTILSKFSQV
jgi:hypothetical protein